MEGKERREAIMQDLQEQKEPVTGTALAKKYNVSRQVIVQDIALIRALGIHILSTSEGYLLSIIKKDTIKRAFTVKHTMNEIEDELCTIVDLGGHIINVIVSHPVYGEIMVDMMISSRKGVSKFMEKLNNKDFVPLMSLTAGEHLHIVEAEDEETLDDIESALKTKGYLVNV